MERNHVRRHLPANTELISQPEQRQTLLALHKAIDLKDIDFIRYLESTEDHFQTLLHTPVSNVTALSRAIMNQDFIMSRELIEIGSSPNHPSIGIFKDLERPLVSAMRLNLFPIVELLIRKGSQVGYQCNLFRNPLAASVDIQEPRYTRLLLDNDSPINFSPACTNPLNSAAQFLHTHFYENPFIQSQFRISYPRNARPICYIIILDELIRAGLNPNLEDEDKLTPLYWSILTNELKVSILLLDAGAQLNTRNSPPIKQALNTLAPSPLTKILRHRLQNPETLKLLSRSSIRSTLRKTYNRDIRKITEDKFPSWFTRYVSYIKMTNIPHHKNVCHD